MTRNVASISVVFISGECVASQTGDAGCGCWARAADAHKIKAHTSPRFMMLILDFCLESGKALKWNGFILDGVKGQDGIGADGLRKKVSR